MLSGDKDLVEQVLSGQPRCKRQSRRKLDPELHPNSSPPAAAGAAADRSLSKLLREWACRSGV